MLGTNEIRQQEYEFNQKQNFNPSPGDPFGPGAESESCNVAKSPTAPIVLSENKKEFLKFIDRIDRPELTKRVRDKWTELFSSLQSLDK